MGSQAAEAIILKDEELVLLLAAAGVENWYGIDLEDKTSFIEDEAKVNRHLAELYRKGMIDWSGSKARISESAGPMMNVLRHSGVCIKCASRALPGVVSGSYPSEGEVVMIERDTADVNELRLTMMSAEEWYTYFSMNGFFPRVMEAPNDMVPDDLYPEQDDKLTDLEVRSIPEGLMLENLMIFDCGVYGMIIDNTLHNSIRKMYSPDEIRSIIYSWAGGASI